MNAQDYCEALHRIVSRRVGQYMRGTVTPSSAILDMWCDASEVMTAAGVPFDETWYLHAVRALVTYGTGADPVEYNATVAALNDRAHRYAAEHFTIVVA